MIQQTILSNGITLVTDAMGTETISIGVYVDSGARRETEENNGVAHFLEHMAFKGTKRRSAEQLAREIEDVGGYMNAYTSLETTAYYCRLMKEDIALGADILADILTNSVFDETEMNRERGAILQEISMYNDSPDDVVSDKLSALQYPGQSIGRPILGSIQNVQNMKPDDLRAYMANYYHANHMVIAAAGGVNHEELVDMLEEKFASFKAKDIAPFEAPEYHGGRVVTERSELEQAYIAYGWKSEGSHSENYYKNVMFSSVMGQGMTSKLWLEVREKRGLAYSVYAGNSTYKDHGTFNVYAGTSKASLPELQDIVIDVLNNAEVKEDDLHRAQKGAAFSIAVAMESTESRMERLANHILTHRRIIPMEEALDKVYAVTLDDINEARTRIIKPETMAVSIVQSK